MKPLPIDIYDLAPGVYRITDDSVKGRAIPLVGDPEPDEGAEHAVIVE